MGEDRVRIGERVHALDHHFLRDAAHLGNAPLDRVELPVVSFDGMVHDGVCSLSRTGQ